MRPRRGQKPEARAGRHPGGKPAAQSRSLKRAAVPENNQRATFTPQRPTAIKPPARLAAGSWLFTCREGAERDLCDELQLRGWQQAGNVIAPALVVAAGAPEGNWRASDLAFARQSFRIALLTDAHSAQATARELTPKLQQLNNYALQVWTPDSTQGNTQTAKARSFETALATALEMALPSVPKVSVSVLAGHARSRLVQACFMVDQKVVIGVDSAANAITLVSGGRTRVHVAGDLPSRSARKLEEALQWFGTAPGPGELCVDLGAAPGGWTYVLCGYGAKVIAVDPGPLREDIAQRRTVRHLRQNAFQFTPDETCDWLFCDMAYRPLEVAALLAKWGRNRWARLLVANVKLPMTKKAEIMMRVKQILETDGAWKNVRAKQLYHDRDEVTLAAYVT